MVKDLPEFTDMQKSKLSKGAQRYISVLEMRLREALDEIKRLMK
jgi:hypothetical protein